MTRTANILGFLAAVLLFLGMFAGLFGAHGSTAPERECSRVRASMYGRSMVIPSLPRAALVSRIELVQSFYGTLPPLPAKLTTPPGEVREEKAAVKAKKAAAVMPSLADRLADEIPF